MRCGLDCGLRFLGQRPVTYWKQMVGLGGLEPPTSPLSGARSSHLSYRPLHRGGTVHKYLIVQWLSVFRNCAESALRYKTATSPVHLLCTISESEFRLSRRVQSAQRQDVLAQPGSAVFGVHPINKQNHNAGPRR